MSKPDATQRAIKMATENAVRLAGKAKNAFTFKIAKDWNTLASHLGITITPVFTSQPYDWPTVSAFARYWVDSVQDRLKKAQEIKVIQPQPKLDIATVECKHFGGITLLPEQQVMVDNFLKAVNDNVTRAGVQDGKTGSGKTFAAAAIIDHFIKTNKHKTMGLELPYAILVVTRKTVVESYKRVLEEAGLGRYLGNVIFVTQYSALTSNIGRIFYSVEYKEDPYSDEPAEEVIRINEVIAPKLIIWDEAHALNNKETKQTKLALAYGRLKNPPIQLFMSATIWTKVNDSRTAVLAARFKYNDMEVTEETFPIFAGSICKEPHKPNIAAAKRLREVLSPIIFSFPYVKWPHKAINSVLLVDFLSKQHEERYAMAFDIYQERKRKAGLNTNYGQFEEFVALNVFRHAVESFRVPAMVERGMASIKSGKTVIMGAAYRETIAQAVFQYEAAGIPRSKMSIIWGGRRKWKKELLLSDSAIDDMVKRVAKGEMLDADELRALQETNLYNTERYMYGETEEEHQVRLAKMESLGLMGNQTQRARQEEIDRFQSGESIVALFTLAAGGVGLSLDHNKPSLLPRESYLTPTFNGPEVKQAMGRGLRRTTLSDIYQYVCFMRGTVEETVAQYLDTKFKCIDAITNNSFNIIDLDTCAKSVHRYRTKEEIEKDADSDEAQLQDFNTESDADDDED